MKEDGLRKAVLYVAMGIIAIVLIWGFMIVGSPSFNRGISADTIRLSNLKTLRQRVENYFSKEHVLPVQLSDLQKVNLYGTLTLEDPLTKEGYGYASIDPFTYELCAVFAFNSEQAQLERYAYEVHDRTWAYDAGRYCFRFKVPQRLQKQAKEQ